MKYYTETILPDLAEKLKAAGMPMEEGGKSIIDWKVPTYAEVFDFFLEKHIYIHVEPAWGYREWIACIIDKTCRVTFPTWNDAANAAIEKTLELI